MSNSHEEDDALLFSALREATLPVADAAFADRVMALASYDLATRRQRRKSLLQVAREAIGFAAAIALFVFLARTDLFRAGPGDALDLASPAMLGVIVIAAWLAAVVGPSSCEPVTAVS